MNSDFHLRTLSEAKNEFRFRFLGTQKAKNEFQLCFPGTQKAKNEFRFCFPDTQKGQNEFRFCFIRTSGSLFEISITLLKHPEKADQKPFFYSLTPYDSQQALLFLFIRTLRTDSGSSFSIRR